MSYRAPLNEIGFALSAMAGADRLAATERFADATPETRAAVIAEAARLAETVLAPLDAPGDREGARLAEGAVRTPAGFPAAWRAIAEGGWCGVAADPAQGGMGLPQTFWTVVNELFCGANLSLSIPALLTAGQIEALEAHAGPAIRALYLPKLIASRWAGTMNLTEPQAGSDVGALRTRAEPDGAGGWRLTDQKIYISWGDHDVAENVCHLVLARIAGAPAGARGVSLFLAPKRLPGPDGEAGAANAVRCVSLERKMGLHASPTCVMAYEGAAAHLVGEPHRGLAAMFTMMNNARLGVAMQGIGVAGAALGQALAWAAERRQGRTPVGDGRGPIAEHPDVRRMLATMRARTQAARAIAYACAVAIDMARAAPAGDRADWAARAAFLTPIAKAFGTDAGCEVASLGMQEMGGAGYVEDAGMAQRLRDVRVTAIYEGANGIQAMDLVGRKLADGGAAARALLTEVAATAAAARGRWPDLGDRLAAAAAALERATGRMLEAPEATDRAAGATPFLRAWALALGAHFLVRGALADARAAALAAFFVRQELPALDACLAAAAEGAAPLYAEGLLG